MDVSAACRFILGVLFVDGLVFGAFYAKSLIIMLGRKVVCFPEFIFELKRLNWIHTPPAPSLLDYILLFPVWILYFPIAIILGLLRQLR